MGERRLVGVYGGDLLSYRKVAVPTTPFSWKGKALLLFPHHWLFSSSSWGSLVRAGVLATGHILASIPAQKSPELGA